MAITTRTRYVLVHGAFSDSSIWDEVKPLLEADGGVVVAPTLPGHGDDAGNAGSATLSAYVETVTDALDASPEPVVLVGHSLSGMTISACAEQLPEKIAALVYVCAYLPEPGMTATDYAKTDAESRFAKQFVPDPERGVGTMTRDGLLDAVFNTSPESVRETVPDPVPPEPLQPFGTPIDLTDARFGSVRRFYVHTTQDRAITPALQKRLVAATPVEREFSVDADHAAPVSAARDVAGAILEAASAARAGAVR